MTQSLNQTVGHLKVLMARIKDVVFPLYSDRETEDAVRDIMDSLTAVTDADTAAAFMERLPACRHRCGSHRAQ